VRRLRSPKKCADVDVHMASIKTAIVCTASGQTCAARKLQADNEHWNHMGQHVGIERTTCGTGHPLRVRAPFARILHFRDCS